MRSPNQLRGIYQVLLLPFRRVAGKHISKKQQKLRTDGLICFALQVPPPSALILASKLRYAAQVSQARTACSSGLASVCAGKDWRKEPLQDLEDMARLLSPRLDALGYPPTSANAWERFWCWFGQVFPCCSTFDIRAVVNTEWIRMSRTTGGVAGNAGKRAKRWRALMRTRSSRTSGSADPTVRSWAASVQLSERISRRRIRLQLHLERDTVQRTEMFEAGLLFIPDKSDILQAESEDKTGEQKQDRWAWLHVKTPPERVRLFRFEICTFGIAVFRHNIRTDTRCPVVRSCSPFQSESEYVSAVSNQTCSHCRSPFTYLSSLFDLTKLCYVELTLVDTLHSL